MRVFVNKIGYPEIAELEDNNNLPGIGEKINLNNKHFEVTDIKENTDNNEINIYVNPL